MKCSLCKVDVNNLNPSYITKEGKSVTVLICDDCNLPNIKLGTEKRRKYQREYMREYNKTYFKRNKYPKQDSNNPKVKARMKLRNAVYRGIINKPKYCEHCEEEC